MQFNLKRMKLENFKGIRNQAFNFSSDLNIISGDNGTGKSTIMDAFLWCLFGKDSTDRATFEVKTLDAQGSVIERLDHEVTLILEVNFKEVTLSRVLREKWTKPHGQEEQVFTGNETTYFWNEVPLKQSDFQSKIKEMIDEGLFKLLTNVMYFHSLHWEKRREIIFSLAGKITDHEVLDHSADLLNKDHTSIITNILNSGKTMAEAKAELSNKQSRIKKELKEFAPRIDEAQKAKPVPMNVSSINKQIKEISDQVETKKSELENIIKAETSYSDKLRLANDAHSKKVEAYYALKTKASSLRNKIESEVRSSQSNNGQEITDAQRKLDEYNREVSSLSSRITKAKDNYAPFAQQIENKRNEWAKVNSEAMPEFDVNACNCPYCKQELPDVNVEDSRKEFETNFNQNKTKRLASISEDGKQLATQQSDLGGLIHSLTEELNEAQVRATLATQELKEIDEARRNKPSIEFLINKALESNEELASLTAEIKSKESIIHETTESDGTSNELFKKRQGIQIDINQLQQEKSELEKQLSGQDAIAKLDARIEDLKKQESDLSHELNLLEKQDFAILQFEKGRVSYIEKRINTQFDYVTFKMFETQVNGSEVSCCKTLINGVPFEDANTASKINAGIDIINALSSFHCIQAPIFIDNAEAVNKYIDTKSQVVRLNVTKDPVLVFESQMAHA